MLGSGSVPAPEDLWLDESGVLSLGFASESAQHPVAGLASLLLQLLDGIDAPPQLRDLAAQNAGSSPAYTTADAFSAQLAFFERPDRSNVLRGVAARLRAARLQVPPAPDEPDPEVELQRLRGKVSGAALPPERPIERPRLTRQHKTIAAAVVALVALVAVVATQWPRLSALRLGGANGQERGPVSNLVSSGLSRLGLAAESSPKVKTEAVEADGPDEPDAAPVPRINPRRVQRPASSDRDVTATSGRTPDSSQPRRNERAVPAAALTANAPPSQAALIGPAAPPAPIFFVGDAADPRDRPDPDVEKVYSRADPEVEPAALLRPQLPREPAPGDETGYFHIVVDEHGNVEQVRLFSPRHRYHDRMLIAAAKAWKFKPARLGGESVRYEVQIPIILKGMP